MKRCCLQRRIRAEEEETRSITVLLLIKNLITGFKSERIAFILSYPNLQTRRKISTRSSLECIFYFCARFSFLSFRAVFPLFFFLLFPFIFYCLEAEFVESNFSSTPRRTGTRFRVINEVKFIEQRR